MSHAVDVVIVGGRCAGAALATLLARAGQRVVVVDQARFPSDSPSTHAIQPNGVRALDRLGVRARLTACTTPIEHGELALDDVRIPIRDLSALTGAPMLNVRRSVLDQILLDNAAAAGADVRTRSRVTGLVERDGRVVGVDTTTGRVCARLVVGADGVRSTVAQLIGAREYAVTEPGRLFVWAYFEGAAHDGGIRLGRIRDHGYLASPTDSDLYIAAVAPDMCRRAEVLADPAAAHARAVADWPELADTLAPARRVGPVRTMPRWRGYFRTSAGPGWVLLGDAGHFKDPTLGQGISDAFRQATTLADTITSTPDDRALHRWWRRRDRDAWEMYWLSRQIGAAGHPRAVTAEIQRLLAADPQRIERLLRVIDHDLAPSRLFTPGLALHALARALRRPGGRADAVGEAAILARDAASRAFRGTRSVSVRL